MTDDVEYVRPQQRLQGRIDVVDYDERWPELYAREEERVRHVLGERVVRVAHAGSTSVPGLPAKPIVDIVLEVPQTADESAYVPDLEAAGYTLTIREPRWFEHRLFKGPDTNINLHVFSRGCSEVDRMLIFRDRLRADANDRDLYARTKRELAARDWEHVQDYADAKTEIVTEIVRRALLAAAARENAEWCDAHAATGEFRDGFWFSRERTPQYYPDAVTLRPGVVAADVLAEIDAGPGCSVKDSFDDLDLPDFHPLFRAKWLVGRREMLPDPDAGWSHVLDAPDVATLTGPGGAHAVAHSSTYVTGLSNVSPTAVWAHAAAHACTVWDHGTIVGYERNAPVESVGELVVWMKT